MSLVTSLLAGVVLLGLIGLLASVVERLTFRVRWVREHDDALFALAAVLVLTLALRIAFFLGGMYI